jgi:hypothetical protein
MKTILVALTLALSACGGAQRDSDTLQESILAYNEGVRWERFEAAASALPPKERSAFVDEMDQRAKDLKISEYDVVRVETKKGSKTATVQLKVAWYKDSEGTLKETHAVQTWERHGKAWYMVEETRLRGDEMPGLMEKPDKGEPKDTNWPSEAADATNAGFRAPRK